MKRNKSIRGGRFPKSYQQMKVQTFWCCRNVTLKSFFQLTTVPATSYPFHSLQTTWLLLSLTKTPSSNNIKELCAWLIAISILRTKSLAMTSKRSLHPTVMMSLEGSITQAQMKSLKSKLCQTLCHRTNVNLPAHGLSGTKRGKHWQSLYWSKTPSSYPTRSTSTWTLIKLQRY